MPSISPPRTLALVLGSHFGQLQGGAELQARYIEQEAVRAGWQTHYCYVSNHTSCSPNHPKGILHPIPRKRLWHKLWDIKYPYAPALWQHLRQIRPDTIYQRVSMAFTGICAHYARIHNCRLVYHVALDKDVEQAFPGNNPFLAPEFGLTQYGIRRADTVVTQTRYQAGQLKRNYHKKALVIPNGHPVPECPDKAEDRINILWIANWKSRKQPEIFVRLAKRLHNIPNVRCHMIGRTETYTGLCSKAQNAGIRVLGELPHNQVKQWLGKSHILVNTSLQEGFSNTFIEAWMRAVPVVSLNVDPDGILAAHGIGFCSGSFEQMVKDVETLVQTPGLRAAAGKKARAYAVSRHSMNSVKAVVELLDNVSSVRLGSCK